MADGNDSQASAVQRVLEIVELIEHIIFMLAGEYILTAAQRVSRKWKNVVEASPKIQQKLFFRPLSPEVVKPDLASTQGNFIVYKERVAGNTIFHAVLSKVTDGGQIRIRHLTRINFAITFHLDRRTRDRFHGDFAAFDEPSASWKKMFVTHPPCSVLCLSYTTIGTYPVSGHNKGVLWLRDQWGIRFELLQEMVDRIKRTTRMYGEDADVRFQTSLWVTLRFWEGI